MAKLFKCPECNKFLHTLCTINHCNTELNIDSAGTIRITHVCSPKVPIFYYCSYCGHKETESKNFISEVNCDCEHFASSIEICNNFKFDVCQHCGLILSAEFIQSED